MHIQFLGATETVTGSKYLITTKRHKILVDCGLFQGLKELRLRNWQKPPINPAEIDYILLTHAHIDHSGYIPLLIKNGFRGKIICSKATKALCSILLPDSGHLHEEEARYANKKGYSKHHPALPLYTQEEAEASLAYFHTVPFDKPIKIDNELQFSFHYAGHILGASFIRIQHFDTSILFSGDLGRFNDPIMLPPSPAIASDYYVIESTYGDRLHKDIDPKEELEDIINRTAKRGGTILIPAFAVGRAQSMLYYIHQLIIENKIPTIPVYIDSPMATDATKLFYQFSHEHRLSREFSEAVCRTAHYTQNVEESKSLDNQKMPMIIISASGMATGGRILHHLKHFAPEHQNTVVFCGFQATQTRGDRMVKGEKQIKMFGQMVSIQAEVIQLNNTSAHADYKDMLNWLGTVKQQPRKVFITHGEAQAANALKDKIENQLKWQCKVPSYLYPEELI